MNRPRSALYAPAHSTQLFTAAVDARPDVVIVDLEDGVPGDEKDLARLALGYLVEQARSADCGVVIRVNATDTEWFSADVDAVLDARPDGILLPKAGTDELREVVDALGPTRAQMQIWALIEQVADVLACEAILSHGIADVVTIGYGDLCKQLQLPLGTEHPEFAGVRRLILAAAATHGVVALDGVVVARPDGVADACARSAADGFVGRTLYDPRHVASCNNSFERGTR